MRKFTLGLITASLGLLALTGCSAGLILDAIDLASYVAQTLATTASTVNTISP